MKNWKVRSMRVKIKCIHEIEMNAIFNGIWLQIEALIGKKKQPDNISFEIPGKETEQ